MKISPYISFNGNCEEAVLFYEKAFNVKADITRYKDAPKENDYQVQPGTENLIMHSQFELNGEMIMFADMPPEYQVKTGSNIAIMAEFDNTESAKSAFDALKEGGNVIMELQETFWSKCFGSLIDKFGIYWNISIGCP
ncbi:MAG: VOC family protein [Treponema sp.]|nr:VOC family protein [Treponema sp.]